MQNSLQIEPPALEIDELADKKLDEGLDPQRMVNYQVEEEMKRLILHKINLQG